MNREIKFRAFFENKFWYFVIGQTLTPYEHYIYSQCCLNGIEFKQFTGLKDQKGKEIYEGDIVSIYGIKQIVKFATSSNEQAGHGECTTTIHSGFSLWSHGRKSASDFEVVGNIYENKELLV